MSVSTGATGTPIDLLLDDLAGSRDNNPFDVIEAIDTALVMVNAIIDAPGDHRFRRIRLSNLNFHERLGHVKHGVDLFRRIGFQPDASDSDFIVLPPDSDDAGRSQTLTSVRQARLAMIKRRKQLALQTDGIPRLSDTHTWVSVRQAGLAHSVGRRPANEDDYVMVDGFAGDPRCGLFCVYDGHGGREAVDFVVRSFHENLSWIMSRRRKQDATTPSCIEAAYLYTDAQLRRRSILESGVTVATVLFVDEGGDRVLYSANAGDTRAVLASWDATSNRVVSKRLSMDHKPSLASEVARVKDAGGFIAGNRVNGVLAVSRALGDHVLKPSVSAVPHITRHVLTGDDRFVIAACDGIWDVMTDDDAALFVNDQLAAAAPTEGNPAGRAASALVTRAFEKQSMDNLTAIVITL
ncbi:PPM-type phosphatase domain-containing protein [Plasmodiophora brassicae]|uniref:PPM-type phosphatase domain-containing protein n=1 Tax=Plasmodiophora brassicae TaxID=37360 RepID=A0A3P3Y8Q3_PLABS|nr:unnamed protein product [Plasmodiophora brassicae]